MNRKWLWLIIPASMFIGAAVWNVAWAMILRLWWGTD